MNKGRKVERFLSIAELARLGAAMAAAERAGGNATMITAIRLLLLTGCRKNEILGLRWEWVDLERGALRLPRAWRKIAEAAKLEAVRLHDLRHGFASVAVADGSRLYILGKVLGHTQARTTEKYANLDADPVLAIADRTSRKIAAALKGGGDGGQVVQLMDRDT